MGEKLRRVVAFRMWGVGKDCLASDLRGFLGSMVNSVSSWAVHLPEVIKQYTKVCCNLERELLTDIGINSERYAE